MKNLRARQALFVLLGLLVLSAIGALLIWASGMGLMFFLGTFFADPGGP